MKNKVMPPLLLLAAVVVALPLLGGCNTTEGAGKDISNTGNAIQRSAEKHKPE